MGGGLINLVGTVNQWPAVLVWWKSLYCMHYWVMRADLYGGSITPALSELTQVWCKTIIGIHFCTIKRIHFLPAVLPSITVFSSMLFLIASRFYYWFDWNGVLQDNAIFVLKFRNNSLSWEKQKLYILCVDVYGAWELPYGGKT